MRRYLGAVLVTCSISLIGSSAMTACSDETDSSGAAATATDLSVTPATDVMGPSDTGPADVSPPDLPTTSDVVEDAAQDGPDVVSCAPFEIECAGPLSQRQCNEHGDGWIEADCPPGAGCVEGECIAQVCTPAQSRLECIDAISYERCNDSGTGWQLEICNNPLKCYGGTCIESFCQPGKLVCEGLTAFKQCDALGDAWTEAQACPKGGICEVGTGTCLSPCVTSVKAGSYLGCEYWAVDLDNIEESEHAPMGIVVSVPTRYSGTNVKVVSNHTGEQLTADALNVDDLFVESGEIKVFTLPPGFDIDGSVKTTRTFKVETTSPVAVHQFNPLNGDGVFSNDASLLLPSLVTGTDYLVMSWPHRKDEFVTLRGFVTVIATQEGFTQVRVVPSAPIKQGQGIAALQPNTPYLFVLNQGEALNFETDGEQGVDLTGTVIEGDKKLSVISGHECANVPLGISACDHLEQQLFPVSTWSDSYVADAFQHRSSTQVDIWRVMAGDNEVTVTTNPPVPGYEQFKLQRGGWIQFASPDSFMLTADGPILVGHYLTGANYPGAVDVQACELTAVGKPEPLGDPAFTLAVPVRRYLSEYSVLTPVGYMRDYLNVVVKPATALTIETCDVDTQVCSTRDVNEQREAVGDTGWERLIIEVVPGIHTLQSVDGTLFGLTAYGYDCDVSYAYPGGLKLQAPQENQ